MMEDNICDDISAIKKLKTAKEYVCEECIKAGGEWVHLRTCQTCGITLCCDESPHKHMTQHYRHAHHPVIISAEPGERWFWCYKHEIAAEY